MTTDAASINTRVFKMIGGLQHIFLPSGFATLLFLAGLAPPSLDVPGAWRAHCWPPPPQYC